MSTSTESPISYTATSTPANTNTFAPNDDTLEQNITKGVAAHATAAGLKTKSLLITDATRTNYLNYMTCPNLEGNFYDGDANPNVIVTHDGTISASDISTVLASKFRLRVTNIWLACEAFNDPMKSAVITSAQTQVYAAGINDLLVGPSDNAAACAMKAAIDGQAMHEAFDACYKKDDKPSDHWGWGGNGSDFLGQGPPSQLPSKSLQVQRASGGSNEIWFRFQWFGSQQPVIASTPAGFPMKIELASPSGVSLQFSSQQPESQNISIVIYQNDVAGLICQVDGALSKQGEITQTWSDCASRGYSSIGIDGAAVTLPADFN